MTVATTARDGGMPLPQPESLDRFESDVRAVRLALGKIPNNRLYACDQTGARGLVALWRASWRMIGDSFNDSDYSELLERVAPFAPSMTQSYRPPEKQVSLELPSDGVTKMWASNPYNRDDAISVASRQVLEERLPALATHLRRLSDDSGYSLKYHFELEDLKLRREALLRFKYGTKEHASNPFLVSGDGVNQSELGRWLQTHDKLTAEIYRLESEPVRLPWSVGSINLTLQGQAFDALRANPTTAGVDGTIILSAVAVDVALLDALRQETEAQVNALAARAKSLR